MRRIALIAALLSALAGCGEGQTAKRPITTAAEWQSRAAAACERAAKAIKDRGWAKDLNEVRTRVPDGAADVQRAIDEIRGMPLPPGDADARLFVADVKAADAMLDDLAAAARAKDLHALSNVTTELDHKLRALSGSADRAGLRGCLQDADPWAAVNGLRAPVAAEQLARLELQLVADLPRHWESDPLTKARSAIRALRTHEDALGSIKPPYWADAAWVRHRGSIRDLRRGLAHIVAAVEAGEQPSDAAVRRATTEAANTAADRLAKVWQRMGAAPVTQPPTESETTA